MCAIVLYRKRINGKIYPKAARTGPYAFAQEVRRVGGKVVTKYVGIVRVPEASKVAEESDVAESATRTNVIERGEEHDYHTRESK